MKTMITALLALWLLAGCNTIAGIGKDLSNAGDSIENAANSNKKKQ
jgi:predicted small secreted protein